MRRRAVLTVSVLALVGVLPSYASTATEPVGFSGTCTLTGVVRFYPGLTNAIRPGRASATATGSCSGTLTGANGPHQVNGAPARYHATEAGPVMSCTVGIDQGRGTLTIGGVSLPFGIAEKRVTAAAIAQLTGHGWSGVLYAAASSQTNPVVVAQDCAGSGLSAAGVQGGIATNTTTGP